MGKSGSFSAQQLLAIAQEVHKPKEVSACVLIALKQWDMGNISPYTLCAVLETVVGNIRKG